MPKRPSVSGHEAALKKRFGAAVRRYRQRLGISQEELAWRSEMHRTYLADVERGARNLSLSSMARLVGGIGVSLAEFFATLETIDASGNGNPHHRGDGGRTAGSGQSRKIRRSSGRAGRRGTR